MNIPKIALLSIYNDTMQPEVEEIGLCLITSVLRNNGYEVLLIFAHEREVDYAKIKDFAPDIVGFTVYKVSEDSVKQVIGQLKEVLPDVWTCVGGKYVSVESKEFLEKNSNIDFLIKGEGEYAFLELVQAIENKSDISLIKNLLYREGERIIENELREPIQDLDSLPYPARDMLSDHKLQTAYVSTSRGCKSQCGFCSIKLHSSKWRGRSITSIVDEIEYIMKNYNVKVFNFIDSSLEDPDNDLERISGIAREILRRGLKISYSGNIRAEFNRKVTPEIMNLLIESGLSAVCIGFEAGNDEDLRFYNKIANVEDNHKAIQLFQSNDIAISPGFINFNPYSTVERLRKNIDFLACYGLAPKFKTRLWAYKGTRIFEKLHADGLIIDPDDSIGYRFVNEDIGKFADYLFDYIDEVDREHNNPFLNFSYCKILFIYELNCYRRLLKEMNDWILLKKLEALIQLHEENLQNFSDDFADWVRGLLDVLETDGFDLGKLQQQTEERMPISLAKEFNNKCISMRQKILLLMARSGYSEQLIDFLRS